MPNITITLNDEMQAIVQRALIAYGEKVAANLLEAQAANAKDRASECHKHALQVTEVEGLVSDAQTAAWQHFYALAGCADLNVFAHGLADDQLALLGVPDSSKFPPLKPTAVHVRFHANRTVRSGKVWVKAAKCWGVWFQSGDAVSWHSTAEHAFLAAKRLAKDVAKDRENVMQRCRAVLAGVAEVTL